MKRGEIWTLAGAGRYAGKSRPAVILQDDRFDISDSITVCAFTTDPTDAPLFRLPINRARLTDCALPVASWRTKSLRKARIGSYVGRFADEDIV